MKKTGLILILLCIYLTGISQNTAITDDDSYTADPSAILDVKSNDKGILIPRLTTAERIAIITPATGLLVYDSDENAFYYYNSTDWLNLTDYNDLMNQPDFTGWDTNVADDFDGDYNSLTNQPTIDGTETIIQEGTNISITGSGSFADPYVISTATVSNITLGDLYEGGIVFYITPDGKHGLIVALSDQYTSVTGESANQYLNDPGKHIGVNQNYTDWRLPDQYEIDLMYTNRSIINAGLTANGGNTFTSSYYWSSRLNYQGGSNIMIYGYTRRLNATNTDFSTFMDGTNGDAASVRAIRSF